MDDGYKVSTGIYRIYHRGTGKSYIGQSVNIANRIFVHFHGYTISNAVNILAADMKVYGKSEFDWEILEICSEDVIDVRESVWIDSLNTIDPNGYNLRSGGSRGKYARKQIEDAVHASKQMPLFKGI